MKTHTIAQVGLLWPGLKWIITGLIVRYIIGKRRFNRRTVTGLQQFSSYEKWWLTTRTESLLMFGALLAIIAGAFILLFK